MPDCYTCNDDKILFPECSCYELTGGGHQLGCPFHGLSRDQARRLSNTPYQCPDCPPNPVLEPGFNRRSWLSRLLCFLCLHRWEYGPGQCCSVCGIPDDMFQTEHGRGRLAVHPQSGHSQYFPDDWKRLPDGWRWF